MLEKLNVKNLLKMYNEIVINISIKNSMLNVFKIDEKISELKIIYKNNKTIKNSFVNEIQLFPIFCRWSKYCENISNMEYFFWTNDNFDDLIRFFDGFLYESSGDFSDDEGDGEIGKDELGV